MAWSLKTPKIPLDLLLHKSKTMITLLKNKSESQIIWSPYTANSNIQCGGLGATIQETQYLKVFEMHCLQAIRGVIRADGLQHIKVREDIFTPESITDVIRHKKNWWFGQVCRCKDITTLGKHTNKTSKDTRREEGH